MLQLTRNELIAFAVDKYSDMVVRIAFQYVHNKTDSEDIAQDVFSTLLKQPVLNNAEHLKAWIIRVTINRSKNHLKYLKRRETVPIEKAQYVFTNEQEQLFSELDKLNEKDRNIIYLFYYEGFSAKEIGKMLGKRESAVFVRLNRARANLKNFLEDN